MDTAKMGRLKERGDCVSVPNNYFGPDYLNAFQVVRFSADRLFGRVLSVQEDRETTHLWSSGMGCTGGWDKNVPGQSPDGRKTTSHQKNLTQCF